MAGEADDGLTPAEKAAYERYTSGKEAAGETPRDPADWRQAVDWFGGQKKLGDRFRDGMSALEQHPAKGYVPERALDGEPKRIYDERSRDGQHGVEYKAGGVSLGRGMQQLAGDRRNLERGRSITTYIRESAEKKMPKEYREEQARLEREFPNQYKVVRVPEHQFRAAIELGTRIERAREERQLEYNKTRLVVEQNRWKSVRQIARDAARWAEQAREAGKPIALGLAIESYQYLKSMLKAQLEVERTHDQVRLQQLGLTLTQARQIERTFAVERERSREPFTRDMGRIAREVVHQAVEVSRQLTVSRDHVLDRVIEQVRVVQAARAQGRTLTPAERAAVRVERSATNRELREARAQERTAQRDFVQSLGLDKELTDAVNAANRAVQIEQDRDLRRGMRVANREVQRSVRAERAAQDVSEHNRVVRENAERHRESPERYPHQAITPEQAKGLDSRQYRAVRDGVPERYDAERNSTMYNVNGRHVSVPFDSREHRLGEIARMAKGNVDPRSIEVARIQMEGNTSEKGRAARPMERGEELPERLKDRTQQRGLGREQSRDVW